MTEMKLTNCLLTALILISCAMFVWTLNYVAAANNTQIPTAISAFNG
ncbi:MAG: hypothetical protein IKU37_06655 [Candidatus Gastranaerophilales bacterium]|nr:hypothetical protein [Candidatus Gastranaerophilales bacterium]